MESDGTHRRRAEQSRQAAGRRPLGFRQADALFGLAETQIGLLRRCRPINGPAASAAHAAWAAAYRRGQRQPLDAHAPPAPDLGPLRRALEQLLLELTDAGPLAALYAARAAELELEARLAERIGQASFFELARQRHAEGPGSEWTEARQLANAWAQLDVEVESGSLHVSDDRSSPDSLIRILERELGLWRLPYRVEVVRELASRAACGEGVICIGAQERLSTREARRIAAHEILGHALPRHAARAHPLGLLRVGAARSTDEEEGRALHIEAATDLQSDARRRELGLRHSAAVAVAGGADAAECVAKLGRFGCGVEEAIAIYARVARGGGLCRELEYVPAWLRFAAASQSEPEVAAWLGYGRLSLAAARVLNAQGLHLPGAATHSRLVSGKRPSYLVAPGDEGV